MRISDWSSDVCSSDLLACRRWFLLWLGVFQDLEQTGIAAVATGIIAGAVAGEMIRLIGVRAVIDQCTGDVQIAPLDSKDQSGFAARIGRVTVGSAKEEDADTVNKADSRPRAGGSTPHTGNGVGGEKGG